MKNPNAPKSSRLTQALKWFSALFFFCAPAVVLAGNDTWTGLGADANWNTAGNWTGANNVNVASLDGTLTLSGVISGSTFGLSKLGNSLLTLSASTETFTGPV